MIPPYERIINMLANCRYLPGSWDKRFVASLEKLVAKGVELKLSDAQVAQLRRLAWEKRKQLRPMGFDPPTEWQGTTEKRYVDDRERLKLLAWNLSVTGDAFPHKGLAHIDTKTEIVETE